jgi:ubiquinone/menaquinone biosynthesis C-methylase UbiE
VSEPRSRAHYSYTTYSDPEVARTFDDRRFGGPIGELIAAAQARVLADSIARFAGRIEGRKVLDVGTGTGRAALLLAREAAEVVGVDASETMLASARQRATAEGLAVRFELGDAHALQFPDRSFDVAVSLRVLMHTPDWQTCLRELCRVANDLVIIDYPSATSVAAMQAVARRAAQALGLRTEAYRVFTDRAMDAELRRSGFEVLARHRQFVLPIALHKALGSRRFTRWIEERFEKAGLLRLFGSPVTLVAQRCASS